MRILFFILLSIAVQAQYKTSVQQPITDSRVPVIILTGQSNAVGQFAAKNYAHIYIPAELYNVDQDSVFIWYEGNYLTRDTSTGTFVNMKPNINTFGWYMQSDPANAGYDVGEVSVELSCSIALSEFYGSKVYVIKTAKGSRDIRSWDKDKDSTQWVELERYVRRATTAILATGKTPYFVSIAWLQGESDIIENQCYRYLGRLRTFVSNIRAINQYTDSMQFVMYDLSLYGNTPTDSMAVINSAYDSLVVDNPELNYIIPTANSSYYNSLHYDCPALLDFGLKWLTAIKQKMIYDGVIQFKTKLVK